MPAHTGDVTSPAGSTVNTLATVNANVGTWNNIAINAKGLATAGSNVAYVTGGPYLPTAGGTVTGSLTVSGNLSIGVATNPCIIQTTGSTQIYAPDGSAFVKGIIIASAAGASQTTHSNTTHTFENAVGSVNFAIFDAASTRNVSGTWAVISGRDLKQDIRPYTRGLDAIIALNPVAFRYRAGTPFATQDQPSRRLFGLLADEVKPIVPEIVGSTTATVRDKETPVDTLEPGNLIYALINAVKELKAEIEVLKAAGAP
jgi:hypothetical protein